MPDRFLERYYEDGVSAIANPNLKGENIDTLELVANYQPWRNLNLRTSLYHWYMTHLITLGIDATNGIPQFSNGTSITADGIELSIDQTWDWGGRFRGSVSLQDAAYQNNTKLNNSPQWLGKVNFTTPLLSFGVRAGYEFQYNSNRQSINGATLAGHPLSNLNFMADQWVRGITVSLGIYNLFDARYYHPAAQTNWQNSFEQDGRQFRLKTVYTF